MASSTSLPLTWNLETVFPGGSSSPELLAWIADVEGKIASFKADLAQAKVPQTADEIPAFSDLLLRSQSILLHIREASSFLGCLNAANVKDEKAQLLNGRVGQIYASYEAAAIQLDHLLLGLSEELFGALIARPEWAEVVGRLQEKRMLAKEQMSPALEALATDLEVDGYQAWGALYNRLVGRMSLEMTVKGETKKYSVGQFNNLLLSGDPAVRKEASAKYEAAWAEQSELFGHTLNSIGGYRLSLYKHRGWTDILHEPLRRNRMTRETLEAMWGTIAANRAPFVQFLERKAKLMGVEKLGWNDVSAPISAAERLIPYDEAAAFIVEHFRTFSPKMADYARHAFDSHWIEVEDRPGKRPGGFHTSMPVSRQSRIFMTYSGRPGNVATLAHELGHGYHTWVMRDLPGWARGYAMNVAETASTFAELIVSDAAVKAAPTKDEQVALLEEKAERSIAFFMNIYARFLFETRFYAERARGPVAVERLNELMVEAQREAFGGVLGSYHPHFWASKLHFYSTGQPFYNFPYTFGFLFSGGIYARAQQEGPAFEQKYIDLLRDTGRTQTEELALRHLGVDLTKPDFWQAAVDLSIADVNAFLKATE